MFGFKTKLDEFEMYIAFSLLFGCVAQMSGLPLQVALFWQYPISVFARFVLKLTAKIRFQRIVNPVVIFARSCLRKSDNDDDYFGYKVLLPYNVSL